MSTKLKLLPFIFLTVIACSNEDHTTKDLRSQIELKDRLKNELQAEANLQGARALEAERAAKEAQVAADKATAAAEQATADKNTAALEAEKSRIDAEVARTASDAAKASKEAADNALADKVAELAKLKSQREAIERAHKAELEAAMKANNPAITEELSRAKETLESLMIPAAGLYYSEATTLNFDGKNCRQFVNIELSGISTYMVICDDNRAQWAKYNAVEFTGVKDRNILGGAGVQLKNEGMTSSCEAKASAFVADSTFNLVPSTAAIDIASSERLGLSINQKPLELLSAGVKLGSMDCLDLIVFAERGDLAGEGRELIKQSAVACKLALGKVSETKLEAGCFTADQQFVK